MEYELAEGVALVEADGAQVILRDNGDAAVLNSTAGIIAGALLSEGQHACVDGLVSRYDVGERAAAADVAAFVEELASHGLIRKCL